MWQLSGSLIIVVAVVGICGAPAKQWSGVFGQDEDFMYEDYDLYYDQKQNGTENVRVNLDGVAFLVPLSQSMSSQAMSLLSGAAMDFLSGGYHVSDAAEGIDYYDQEISESPYIEHVAKPEKPPQDTQHSAEQQGGSMEITPPPNFSSTEIKQKLAEDNEILDVATQPTGQIRDKGRFKDIHRRNKHTRPFFRPLFNRFLSRLIPT